MGSSRQRNIALEAISMVMLEEGKILNKHEYEHIKTRTLIRAGTVLNLFGTWSRMLGIIETSFPEVWAEIKLKENPPKLVPPKAPKPKAAVKPATKLAVNRG